METDGEERVEGVALETEGQTGCCKKKNVAVVILLTVNLLNYMDRFTIAGVLTRLQEYFTINDQEAGLMQTMFIVFYMLFAPICGYLGDRFSRKLIMSIGLTFWIVAVLLSTIVGRNHFYLFLFFRGLVGIGEASYSTVAPTIIADLFKGRARSTVLMIFYFAVPVGSGLGYVGGSYFALWTESWQGGVRFTPLIGVICLVAMLVFLEEPARGQIEHAELEPSTLYQDLCYLKDVKTYRTICVGFTCVVFAVGALSWWTPNFVGYAYAMQKGMAPSSADMAHVSLVFGVITCLAGVAGVVLGSVTSAAWREGRWGLPVNPCAEAHVCAIGSILGVPFLYTCLLVARHNIIIAWTLLFFAVTAMCLNWAINMDILMSVIVANRRATATAIQTLLSHLFGDAASPYIIGMLSDAIRGNNPSYAARYFALQESLLLPPFLLVISGGFYLWTSFYMVDDIRAARLSQYTESADYEEEEDDVQTLISNVRRYSGEEPELSVEAAS